MYLPLPLLLLVLLLPPSATTSRFDPYAHVASFSTSFSSFSPPASLRGATAASTAAPRPPLSPEVLFERFIVGVFGPSPRHYCDYQFPGGYDTVRRAAARQHANPEDMLEKLFGWQQQNCALCMRSDYARLAKTPQGTLCTCTDASGTMNVCQAEDGVCWPEAPFDLDGGDGNGDGRGEPTGGCAEGTVDCMAATLLLKFGKVDAMCDYGIGAQEIFQIYSFGTDQQGVEELLETWQAAHCDKCYSGPKLDAEALPPPPPPPPVVERIASFNGLKELPLECVEAKCGTEQCVSPDGVCFPTLLDGKTCFGDGMVSCAGGAA